MKKHVFYSTLLFLLTFQIGTSQEINQTKIDARGNEMLLGKVNKKGLISPNYVAWFNQQHKAYEVNSKIIKSIKSELTTYKITLFMATWCGDSRREVPRFYKILEKANFPMNQLNVVALDHEKDQYKKSPGGEEKGLNILKVPTFIFYRDGKVVNRIVESPILSLEEDIQAIITDKDYVPKYNDIPALPVD